MKYVKKFASKLFDLFFPPRTDDEELAREIRETVKYLASLEQEASDRRMNMNVLNYYNDHCNLKGLKVVWIVKNQSKEL